MPDEYEETEEQENENIRKLRQKAKEYDTLQSQLAERERELAFAKAKLDLDDPKMSYFIKGYDGDLTSDAIRAKAMEDGFIPKDTRNEGELNSQQRIANASSGAGGAPNPNFLDMLKEAKTPEEVMALVTQEGLPTTWNRPD